MLPLVKVPAFFSWTFALLVLKTPGISCKNLPSTETRDLLQLYEQERLNVHTGANSSQLLSTISLESQRHGSYKSIDYTKSTSQFLLELFANLQTGDDLARATGHISGPLVALKPDTIRCYSSKVRERPGVSKKVTYEYRVPRLPRRERLLLAEFRVDKKTVKEHPRKLKITVERGGSLLRTSIVRVKPFSSSDDRHLVYDVTKSLAPWMNGYHGNLTIKVQIRNQKNAPKPTSQSTTATNEPTFENQEALLVLFSENKGFLENIYNSYTEQEIPETNAPKSRQPRELRELKKRRKNNKKRRNRVRWTPKKSKKSGKLCQRHDFEVDFNTIGWGQWIIFPKKFNSFLCHGKCPSPINAKLQPTNHAMMQSLMREKKPNIAPMPCCVPTKLNALSMLYHEHEEIVLRHHEDMVAAECGCQ